MIVINDKWTIQTDPRNYIVCQDHVTQEGEHAGEHYQTQEGFYSTLNGALQAIINRETMDVLSEGNFSLREAIQEIRRIQQDLRRTIESAIG